MLTGRHIFLTGFMGSGKSLLGKKTAALMGFDFVDLDSWIEQRERCTIPNIFEQQGEKAFRNIETQSLQEVIALPKATIVALGGGTVCFNHNLQLVKQAGLLVYIRLSATTLVDRLSNSKTERPLLKGLPLQQLAERVSVLLNQRKSFYEQAHFIVNGINLTAQELQQQISDYQQAHTAR